MTNLLAGAQWIMDQGRQGRQQYVERNLNRLTGQAMNAGGDERRSLVQQATELDRGAGVQLQGQLDDRDERAYRKAVGAARFVLEGLDDPNPQVASARYREVVPFLAELGRAEGKVPPPEFDPQMRPMLERLVAMGGDNAQGQPTGFRQFDMTARAAGLKPGTPEYQRAAAVNLGIEGRAATGGFGFEMVEGPDGRKRLQRRNPRTGVTEIYDESTGDFLPMGRAGEGGGLGGQVAPRVASVEVDGLSPEANAAIERGVAALVQAGVPQAQIDAWVESQASQPRTVTAPALGRSAGRLGVSRTPEEEAAAVAAAKESVEIGNLATRNAIETQGAIDRVRGEAQVKTDIERQTDAAKKGRDADKSIGLIEEALNILPNASGGVLPAAGDAVAGAVGVSTQGAQANAQLKLIAAELVAAVPRFEGPQSNIDVQFYREAAGDLANANLPVATRMAAARKLLELKRKAAAQASGAAPSAPPAVAPPRGAPRGGGSVPRARNPQTGQIVEYRNGQWVPAR